jgi:hypothetical protein
MSWVSQTNLKTIMTAIRNKFTTGDLVIANDDKSVGVEVNHTAQDGLVTVSPISTDASVESALHLSNGDDSKKTELTQGTLSYVTGTGDSEEYNYMSLLGDGVTFGKKGGGNVQIGGVADPTSAQQVATKNYVDSAIPTTPKLTLVKKTIYNTLDTKIQAQGVTTITSSKFTITSGQRIAGSSVIVTPNQSVKAPSTMLPDVNFLINSSGEYSVLLRAHNYSTSSEITVPSGLTFDVIITLIEEA